MDDVFHGPSREIIRREIIRMKNRAQNIKKFYD